MEWQIVACDLNHLSSICNSYHWFWSCSLEAHKTNANLSYGSSLNIEGCHLLMSSSLCFLVTLDLCTSFSPGMAVFQVSLPSATLFWREASVHQCSAWGWPRTSRNSKCCVGQPGQGKSALHLLIQKILGHHRSRTISIQDTLAWLTFSKSATPWKSKTIRTWK